MRRLLLIFPLVVADVVKDFHDPVWEMVLQLSQIASLVCAPRLSPGQIALLNSHIVAYITYRLECFPKTKRRPKHQYILHYPELMVHFGPLKHLWTLRCGSKHSYFKRLLEAYQNYKNVTQMLAEKHQLMQCESDEKYEAFVESENFVDWRIGVLKNSMLILTLQYKSSVEIMIAVLNMLPLRFHLEVRRTQKAIFLRRYRYLWQLNYM